MNGKYATSSSLEGQLAAVAMHVIEKVRSRINQAGDSQIPGVSDFEEAFRVHVKIAELKIRIQERDKLDQGHADRRADLVQQLYVLMAQRPSEFNYER